MSKISSEPSKIWIIAGPTASGKSTLALKLAERCNGEILNADSMQTYRDLRVLTARPSIVDEQRVPHHGYGILGLYDSFSTGAWRRWVHLQIERLQSKGKSIFIVGGTGLYLKAITQPFVDLPDIDPTVRTMITVQIAQHGLAKYYHKLQQVDPQSAAKISAQDRQRITRALEVIAATNIPLSTWQTEHCILPRYQFTTILMQPPKETLRIKAEQRIDQMIIDGAIDEINALIQQHIPLSAPIYRALGARELWQYLHNQLTLEAAIALIKQTTRQYIKRQYTWFRHQFQADYVLSHNDDVQMFFEKLYIKYR